ncbi:MAG: ABC transporter substrate-binding protein [Deltaproteobacteria bacterium]|nr:ABC transporter substrate-binding protein [Deltaproteobacteria bacterium]
MAFVYENGDWGKGFAGQWKMLAEKGGYKVVLDEPYPSTATDLSPVVQKIRRAKPDVLMLVSNAADAILLTNTLAEYKVKLKAIIASGGGHADPSFMKAAGKNARYLFDIVEWETDVNKPGAKETNEKYKAKYGQNLTGEAVDAYLAMYVLKDALERAASLDPAKIRDALAATNLTSGPAMIVGYDADRIRRHRPEQARLPGDGSGQRHGQGPGTDHGVAQGRPPCRLHPGLPHAVK